MIDRSRLQEDALPWAPFYCRVGIKRTRCVGVIS
jgi:hypothetical protein